MFYPLFIAFMFIFISELGDKTQLLVLSFSSKQKTINILLGIALGSLLSHGIAILFGSSLGLIENIYIEKILKLFTYISFIVFGLINLLKKNSSDFPDNYNNKNNIMRKLSNCKLNYLFIIALSIAIGELGDKTFLASIGLGIQYPNYKISLVIGAILGMVMSDLLAIIFGKLLSKKISEETMRKISGILFLIFGIMGFIN